MPTIREKLAALIKLKRESYGWEKKDLVYETGIKYSTLINYENNLRFPPPENLQRLAQKLDIDLNALFGLKPFYEQDPGMQKLLTLCRKLDTEDISFLIRLAEALIKIKIEERL